LRRRNRAVLRHVQHFVAAVAVGVVRRGVVVHNLLQNYVTAREGFDVSAFLQTAQQRVVICPFVQVLGSLSEAPAYFLLCRADYLIVSFSLAWLR
jgi:hypothetical protein